MPNISISKKDLEVLLKQTISIDELKSLLQLVKGEFKEVIGDELKVELTDTNRPDLWCAEGIAREIKGIKSPEFKVKSSKTYEFLMASPKSFLEIIVDENIQKIRPYICGVLARNVALDDLSLQQLIQTQEKLASLYGHNRKDIAIGIYNADELIFPLHYRAVLPSERKFVPLDFWKN